MTLTLNGTVLSFVLADAIYYLLKTAFDLFITEPTTNKLLTIILVIVCIIIAFTAQIYIHA